jgi:anti-anti-sigma factor
MPIKCEEYNSVCVISVDGDFVGDEIGAARKVFDDRVEGRQIVSFVFDLEKSGFVDSEGLEFLLQTKRKCEDMFGQVKLAGADDNVQKILEITRLQHRFECHPDLTAALKNMR